MNFYKEIMRKKIKVIIIISYLQSFKIKIVSSILQ